MEKIIKVEIEQVSHMLVYAMEQMKKYEKDLVDRPRRNRNGVHNRCLHEICLNHRFAYYVEEYIRANLKYTYFVDIEYNRHRLDEKMVYILGMGKNVKTRPDIIVHTRRENIEGIAPNYLIIEAKKDEVSEEDKKKIKAFIDDPRYQYQFGAQIIYYDLVHPTIILYYREEGEIKEKSLS